MNRQEKPFWKSKELWMALFPIVNEGLRFVGLPTFELDEGFYIAWIGLIGAVRLFFTSTKLTT